MSFKSLAQSLFKLSGSQAMPSSSNVDLAIPASGQWSEQFTAPFDGYVEAFFLNSRAVELSNVTTTLRTKTESEISAGAYLPVHKGDQFIVYFDYKDTEGAYFKIVKTVGAS